MNIIRKKCRSKHINLCRLGGNNKIPQIRGNLPSWLEMELAKPKLLRLRRYAKPNAKSVLNNETII